MRNRLFAFIAASAVAFTVVCLPLATPTSASSCDDIKFIFARGSGQSLGATEYSAYQNSLEDVMLARPDLKYGFYELGTSSHGKARYPAVQIDTMVAISAKISAGKAFSFGESVKQGVAELTAYINEISSVCTQTKFVLAGYSQGAMVVTMSVPELDASKILYAATFGDPYLYLPEGKGLFPDACRGKNLSDYREFAPNCYTSAGILGAMKPYEPADWVGKIGLWCNDHDFMCGAGFAVAVSLSGKNSASSLVDSALAAGHLNYASDGHFESAAQIILEKIKTAFPASSPTTVKKSSQNRDTVILLDRTTSMSNHINSYITQAKRLAKETLESGGRIALYTFGDLDDARALRDSSIITPERLVDFGASYEEFCTAIENIKLAGGGDLNESALSALLGVMNTQHWKAGANKSIILLTDAGYLSPDRDGTTLEQVVRRSLEIDPVNVYVINPTSSASVYNKLVKLTNGQLFKTTTSSDSTDYVMERPTVSLPLANYAGAAGEEFTFVANSEDDIVSYEWDLDFDGIFETAGGSTISTSYPAPRSGFVQVKATDRNGLSSTASAMVTVSAADEMTLPQLSNLRYTSTHDSATLDFDFSSGAVAAALSVNGALLGITDVAHLEITDLTAPASVTLTPISTTGRTGTPISAMLLLEKSDTVTIPSDSTSLPNILSASNSGQGGAISPLNSASSSKSTDSPSKNSDKILAPNAGKR